MIGADRLERLYVKYNRRRYVSPDPLQFLYEYPAVCDREIVGLIASSLAYGRVNQIIVSTALILEPMGRHPRRFLLSTAPRAIQSLYRRFKHRFATGVEMSALLADVGRILNEYGSLNACFVAGLCASDTTVLGGLTKFAAEFRCRGNHLIPVPESGSACKRLNLFLRWMVRKDAVDPGGWRGVSPSQLIVPLDTHMARIAREQGLTSRRSADMKMALEITDAFRKYRPNDPVRYDFALTRLGIHPVVKTSVFPS